MPTIKDVAKSRSICCNSLSGHQCRFGVNVSKEEKRGEGHRRAELPAEPYSSGAFKRQTKTIAYVVPTIQRVLLRWLTSSRTRRSRDSMAFICAIHSNLDRIDLYGYPDREQSGRIVATLTWDIVDRVHKAISAENIPIVGLAGARVIEGIDGYHRRRHGDGSLSGT